MKPPLTAAVLNQLTSRVIAAAIDLHRALGPGLLEGPYLMCLAHDLAAAGLRVETQCSVPLIYRDLNINCAYRVDLLVEDVLLIEIKALENVAAIHRRQLSTYLRLTKCPVGLLLNFGAMTMKEGIVRMVCNFPDR